MFTFRKTNETGLSDEEKKMAQELNEAIAKAETNKTGSDEDNKSFPGDELEPVEMLSSFIAGYLSGMVADRFGPMADEMGMEAAKRLVLEVENSDSKTAVKMLQAMFLSNGMIHEAEDLDMLDLCERYDDEAYNSFIDYLFDTDIFDWYSVECLFDGFKRDPEKVQIGEGVVICQKL